MENGVMVYTGEKMEKISSIKNPMTKYTLIHTKK